MGSRYELPPGSQLPSGPVGLRELWDRQADEWAEFARSADHDHFFWSFNGPAFLSLLPPPGHLTVDVGCGEGRLTAELAGSGHRIVGVDGSPRMAALSQQRPELESIVVADGGRLPLRNATADLVIAFMCLQDFDDLEAAAGEASRVLMPGGRFCAAVAHPFRSAGGFDSKDPDSRFSVIDSYFDRRPWLWTHSHSGIEVQLPGVHRPIEDYCSALTSAGLLIEVLREPRPSPEVVKDRLPLQRWSRIPCFLHIRALKPSAPD